METGNGPKGGPEGLRPLQLVASGSGSDSPRVIRRKLTLVGGEPSTPAGFLAKDGRLDHQHINWLVQTVDVSHDVWCDSMVVRLFIPNCEDALASDADRLLACVMMRDWSPTQTKAYMHVVQVASWMLGVRQARQNSKEQDFICCLSNTGADSAWAEDRVLFRQATGWHIARRAFALRQPYGCPLAALCNPRVRLLKLNWNPLSGIGMSVPCTVLENGEEQFPAGTLTTLAVRLEHLYPLLKVLRPQ